MPIYEYTCKKCGDFEVTQRITEDPLKKCPTCGAKVSKLISRAAFHLKGSGWYMTDYGKNGASGSKAEDSKTPTSDTKETGSSAAKESSAKETSASATKETSSSATKESGTKESTAAA
jgi:putative FmdB family regulatory protein